MVAATTDTFRTYERGGTTYQPRVRHSVRCGRSVPSVVSSPWPGWTTVSSSKRPKILLSRSFIKEVKSSGLLVLPGPPGKQAVPGEQMRRAGCPRTQSVIEPGVCPTSPITSSRLRAQFDMITVPDPDHALNGGSGADRIEIRLAADQSGTGGSGDRAVAPASDQRADVSSRWCPEADRR